jgi:hypothetical protein
MKNRYELYTNLLENELPLINASFNSILAVKDNVVIPFRDAPTMLHYEDERSFNTGTISALKLIHADYNDFKLITGDIHTENNTAYITAIHNTYINPMVAHFEDVLQFGMSALHDATIFVTYDMAIEGGVSIYAIHPDLDVEYEHSMFYDIDLSKMDIYETPETQYTVDPITYERAYHHHKVVLDKTFLNIRFPRFIESHAKLIELIKKAGIEQTIHAKFAVLKEQGYEQTNTSQYTKLLVDGTPSDTRFTNRVLYIKLKKVQKKIRKLWEYNRFDIAGHSCIMRTVLTIDNKSTATKDAILNAAKSNKGVLGSETHVGYRLGKLWLTVYNPKTRHIIHTPIAKASRLYGVQVEGVDYPEESWKDILNESIASYHTQCAITQERSLFDIGASNSIGDIGLSCDPSKITLNRHTFAITLKTGLVPILFADHSVSHDDAWTNMVYLIKNYGFLTNFSTIHKHMITVASTYVPFSKAIATAIRKDYFIIASKALNKHFTTQKIDKLYTDKDGESWDEYMWYQYIEIDDKKNNIGVFIIGFKQLRPTDAKPTDFYAVSISDIYGIFYDVAHNSLATPLVASDGTLNQVPTVPIQPLYLAKYNNLTITPVDINRSSLGSHTTLKVDNIHLSSEGTLFSSKPIDNPTWNIRDIQNVQNKLRSVIAHEHAINNTVHFTKDLTQVVESDMGSTILLASIPRSIAYEHTIDYASNAEPQISKNVETTIAHIKNANAIIARESIYVKQIDVVYDKDIQIIGHLYRLV